MTTAATRFPSRQTDCPEARGWPLERILFLMAGTMTAISAILAAAVTPWFLLLTGFVAVNQLAFVTLGNCPSSWLLRNKLGVRSAAQMGAEGHGR